MTTQPPSQKALVPFVSVANMMRFVNAIGIETILRELTDAVEAEFARWPDFDKTPRIAAHAPEGVVELMPASDGAFYGFKYVNGHPKNVRQGRQTVVALGLLADLSTGYPVLLTEMTLLTALRTAATSAMVTRRLARKGSRTLALIGNGAQAEFQALALATVCGIDAVRLFDIDPLASEKVARNLAGRGVSTIVCATPEAALEGADVITTCTADKRSATILTDNLVGGGVHINAIGGDCPGKTELHPDVLRRGAVFVEYAPQTRIEGDIQQLPADFPVTEIWQVVVGAKPGRRNDAEVTVFDGVGFAIEDFAALRYLERRIKGGDYHEPLDLIADPDDPRDLFGMFLRAK